MTSAPALGYFETAGRTNAEAKAGLDALVAIMYEQWGGAPIAAYTVASNTLQPAVGAFTVDAGAAATINTIDYTNMPDGRFVILRCVNAGRPITLKNAYGASGQILTASHADVVLNDPTVSVILQRQGTIWVEVLLRTASAALYTAPAPTPSTLGGLYSFTGSTTAVMTALTTTGVATLSQVPFSALSGAATSAQLPNPTTSQIGGMRACAGAASQYISALTTTGIAVLSQPDFTTLSGNIAPAQDYMLGVNLGSALSGLVKLDLSAGQYFYGTIAGPTQFYIANAPASSFTTEFTLELTNGGLSVPTFVNGMWAGLAAPSLSVAGTDIVKGSVRGGSRAIYSVLELNTCQPPALDMPFNTLSQLTTVSNSQIGGLAGTTLTRAGTAMGFNSAGVLCKADTNVARLDWSYVTANLLNGSGNLANTNYWTQSNVSIVPNSVLAPDNSMSAALLQTAPGSHVEYVTQSTTLVGSATYTASVYVRAQSWRYLQIVLDDSSANGALVNVDTTTGVLSGGGNIGTGSAYASSTTSIGNGWYRISLTGAHSSSTVRLIIFPTVNAGSTYASPVTGDGTGFYLWAPQLELGSTMNTYQPTQTQNLLTYTSQFANAAWTKTAATVAANSTTAPDGTITATSLITANATSIQNTTQSVTGQAANAPFTGSIYVKQGTWRYLQVLVDDGTNGAFVNIDTQTGTLGTVTATGSGTVGAATITPANNGFYRVTLASTSSGTTKRVIYGLSNSLTDTALQAAVGDGAKLLYIWGAQLEQASVASTYQPVLATPGVLMLVQGVRVEQAGTNFFFYSEDFTNGTYWPKGTGVTSSGDQFVAPDGNLTADKLICANSTTSQYALQSVGALTSGAIYTASVFIKQGTWRYVQLSNDDGGSNISWVNFDSQVGAIGSVYTSGSIYGTPVATVTALANGWYRLSLAASIAGTVKRATITLVSSLTDTQYQSATGDGSKYTILWGAMLEAGSVASSYIYSGASQGARAADILTANVANGNYDVLVQDKTSAGWLYNQAASGGAGLTVLPRGGNLLTYSEQFDNAAWTTTAATITANTMTAPDGSVTGDAFVENSASTQHQTAHLYTKPGISQTLTFSVFFKPVPGVLRNIELNMNDGSNGAYVFINTTTGAAVSGPAGYGTNAFTSTSFTYTTLPNGWARATLTATTYTSTNLTTNVLPVNGATDNYAGNNASGFYLWGAQLEQGSTATAYTPTTSAAVAAQTSIARLRDFTAGALNAAQQATLKVTA